MISWPTLFQVSLVTRYCISCLHFSDIQYYKLRAMPTNQSNPKQRIYMLWHRKVLNRNTAHANGFPDLTEVCVFILRTFVARDNMTSGSLRKYSGGGMDIISLNSLWLLHLGWRLLRRGRKKRWLKTSETGWCGAVSGTSLNYTLSFELQLRETT
jgi:hypothetical protein